MKKEKTTVSKLEMFDALMENIPDSIYFKDLKSKFIGISKALAERLKINNSNEALGKTDFDFFTKEHADKAFCDEQNIIKTKIPFIEIEEKETYEGRKDSWVSTIKTPLYDKKRKIIGTFGISRDITESKKAEHIIDERMKELQAFYGLAQITEKEGITLHKLYQEVVNILPKSWQYPEVTFARMVIGDNEFRTKNYLESAWKQSAPIKVFGSAGGIVEVGYLEERPVEDEGPFLKEERRLINAIAERLGRITERKKTEILLRESEEKFRTLFNTSVEGILITEIKTHIFKYANPAICQMFGYSEKELIAMGITDIIPKEALQSVLAVFQDQTHGTYFLASDIPCLRKDGTIFYADINNTNIVIDGLKCGAGFFHDTTERKKAETEILYLSYHDQLTGLYNRRFFNEELKRLDTKRQLPASIIMADVDGLKYVNDNYGHEKGDSLLIAASEIIKNSCRKEDIITRWGGDEFVIFLPKTSEKDARGVIDRIRKASKVQNLEDGITISISLGLTTKNDLNEKIEHIIEQADKNMYIDKARLKKS